MQYDRQTVNLILEIKRSLPIHLQDDFKLASPDLIDNVKTIYLVTKIDHVRALAAKFLDTAGIEATSLRRSGSSLLTRLSGAVGATGKATKLRSQNQP